MKFMELSLNDGLEISAIHNRLNGSCERGTELKFVTLKPECQNVQTNSSTPSGHENADSKAQLVDWMLGEFKLHITQENDMSLHCT